MLCEGLVSRFWPFRGLLRGCFLLRCLRQAPCLRPIAFLAASTLRPDVGNHLFLLAVGFATGLRFPRLAAAACLLSGCACRLLPFKRRKQLGAAQVRLCHPRVIVRATADPPNQVLHGVGIALKALVDDGVHFEVPIAIALVVVVVLVAARCCFALWHI